MTRTKRRTISIVIIERWLFLWDDAEAPSEPNFDALPERETPLDEFVTPVAQPQCYAITRIITSTQTTFVTGLSEKEPT